ncbi:TonB family protein [Lysobacter sp. P5_B9]
MGNSRVAAALVIAMAAAPVSAQQVPAAATDSCAPGTPLRMPIYPGEMAAREISGNVVLDLTIDKCGRVLDTRLKQADKRAFNDAALASVKGVTLPESLRANAIDGHVALPIAFNLGPILTYQKVDWPKTHQRPRYEVDDVPMAYASADAANKAIQSSPDLVWPSPYPVQSRFVQVGEPGAREFWLFTFKSGSVNVAAHYRPVMVEGEPVVKLAMRCEDTAEACSKAQEFLLQGLPFAKARK